MTHQKTGPCAVRVCWIALKIQELESHGNQRHQPGKDFAEAAIRKPAFHPRANHARQKNVHQRVDDHHRNCGQRQRMVCHCDAHGGRQQSQAAHNRARRQHADQCSQHHVPPKPKRKAHQRRRIEIRGSGGKALAVDAHEKPKHRNSGKQRRQTLRMVLCNRHPRKISAAKNGTDRRHRHHRPHDDAQNDKKDKPDNLPWLFRPSPKKAVDEYAPAQPGHRRELHPRGNVSRQSRHPFSAR